MRFVSVLLAVTHLHGAAAHRRSRDAEQPLALLQASSESVEAQAEASSVGPVSVEVSSISSLWDHSTVSALVSGEPGTAFLDVYEKVKTMIGQRGPIGGLSQLQIVFSLLLWILLTAVIAYFWQGREVLAADPSKSAEGFDSWKFGFCFCFDDPLVCLCAFCCPAIRWAETISFVPGLLKFWPAFFVLMILLACRLVVVASLFGFVALVVMCTYYRQELRQRFGMRSGGVTCVADCLSYCCCMCCAISQEARHVEEALRCGHDTAQCPPDRKQAAPLI